MKTIILIDDDVNIRVTYSMVLRHHGYRVFEAATGEEGLALARQQRPDLVVTDVVMPGIDGKAVLEQIRHDPDLADTQVVMITGHPDAVPPRRGMEMGADDFLLKPLRLDALLRCVEARFNRAQVHWRVEDRLLNDLRSTMHATTPIAFSTPLAGILGLTSLLRSELRKLTPDEIENVLEDITNTALRLQRTQRNYLMLLDLSLDAPPAYLTADPLGPTERNESILAGLRATLARTRRKDDVSVDIKDTSLLICGDDLSLIIEELVDNACNYSRTGSPVTVHLSPEGVLTITDNGRGLTPDELRRIGSFQKFDRLNSHGFGLGLILVQKLATKWGAKFSISSRPSGGTKVEVTFLLSTFSS